VPVSERRQPRLEAAHIGAGAEREAQPGARVDARDLEDDSLGLVDVLGEAGIGQERHARVVEGMVADQVTLCRRAAGEVREGLHPSALEEDGRRRLEPAELVQHPSGMLAMVWTIRVLGVERECDARSVAHFSTPVMTMPRMKNRWARKKTTIGIAIVMSVAAWTSWVCSL